MKKHLHLWKQYTIIYFVVERTYFNIHQIGNAPLAQLVEHLTLNQGVQGSSPWRRTERTVFEAWSLGGGSFFGAGNPHKYGIFSFPL